MKRLLLLSGLMVLTGTLGADATVYASGVACTPKNAPYVAPLAVGTVVLSCYVMPKWWAGNVIVSPKQGQFVVADRTRRTMNIRVGRTPIQAGVYQIWITAVP